VPSQASGRSARRIPGRLGVLAAEARGRCLRVRAGQERYGESTTAIATTSVLFHKDRSLRQFPKLRTEESLRGSLERKKGLTMAFGLHLRRSEPFDSHLRGRWAVFARTSRRARGGVLRIIEVSTS